MNNFPEFASLGIKAVSSLTKIHFMVKAFIANVVKYLF